MDKPARNAEKEVVVAIKKWLLIMGILGKTYLYWAYWLSKVAIF